MRLGICSSSVEKIDQKYMRDCDDYLEGLFSLSYDLVFGAYDKGIMNLSYQKALKYQRKIIGITPQGFADDLKRLRCTKEFVTEGIGKRTEELIRQSDALIFLPGGIGTIYELLTAIELKRSGEFDKPIIVYNGNGYYSKLLDFFEMMYEEHFADESIRECYYVTENSHDTVVYLDQYFTSKKGQKQDLSIILRQIFMNVNVQKKRLRISSDFLNLFGVNDSSFGVGVAGGEGDNSIGAI